MTYRNKRMTKEQYKIALRNGMGVFDDPANEPRLPKHGFRPYSGNVVRTPRPFLIEGLLQHGEKLLISGKPKTLKTRFLIVLAISIATGIPFLDHYAVPQRRRVALMLLEDERYEVELFISNFCREHGIDDAELSNWLALWCRDNGRISLSDHDNLLTAGAFVSRYDIFFLGLDNWGLVGEDSNIDVEVRRQLDNFANLRPRDIKGAACGMAVHETKGQRRRDARIGDRIRGAGFAEWYDVGIFLSRRNNRSPVVVEFDLRYRVSPEPFIIPVEGEDSWTRQASENLVGVTDLRENESAAYRPAIIEALKEYPRCSKNKIVTEVGGPRSTIEREFHAMVEEGIAGYAPGRGQKGSQCWLIEQHAEHDQTFASST